MEHNLQRAVDWIDARLEHFGVPQQLSAMDVMMRLKPLCELALAADLLSGSVARAVRWREMIWREVQQGDRVALPLLARPDFLEAASLQVHMSRYGFNSQKLVSAIITAARLVTAERSELPSWRRLAIVYNLWRMGLRDEQDLSAAFNASWLSALPEPWTISETAGYGVTHHIFYLTSFGEFGHLVPEEVLDYLGLWLPVWLDYFTGRRNWDLSAELLLCACYLDFDLGEYEEYTSRLASAQRENGVLPGPPLAGRDLYNERDTAERREFLANYHTTLVGALAYAEVGKRTASGMVPISRSV